MYITDKCWFQYNLNEQHHIFLVSRSKLTPHPFIHRCSDAQTYAARLSFHHGCSQLEVKEDVRLQDVKSVFYQHSLTLTFPTLRFELHRAIPDNDNDSVWNLCICVVCLPSRLYPPTPPQTDPHCCSLAWASVSFHLYTVIQRRLSLSLC